MNTEDLVVIGAGEHAAVLVDVLSRCNRLPRQAVDPESSNRLQAIRPEFHVVQTDSEAGLDPARSTRLINGIGFAPDSVRRESVHHRYTALGYSFASVFADSAIISDMAELGEGVQLLHGSCVQSGASIGDSVIVNTRAIVEHDCIVGAHAHIAPGAILCGAVVVGARVFIGAGAVVIPGVTLGDRAIVGAGVTVRKDVPASTRYVG